MQKVTVNQCARLALDVLAEFKGVTTLTAEAVIRKAKLADGAPFPPESHRTMKRALERFCWVGVCARTLIGRRNVPTYELIVEPSKIDQGEPFRRQKTGHAGPMPDDFGKDDDHEEETPEPGHGGRRGGGEDSDGDGSDSYWKSRYDTTQEILEDERAKINNLNKALSTAAETTKELNKKLTEWDEKKEAEIEQVRKEQASKVKRIEIKYKSKTVTVEGKPHPEYEHVLRLCAARINVLLIGPAGSGKSYLAEQVAEGMELPFYFIGCSAGMSEGHLLGRLLPTGDAGRFEYSRSEFVRAYEEGGMFLFDEIDAADSNTLLVVNTALSGHHMSVPSRVKKPLAKKHDNFVCMAAANTYGTGADRLYVGRNQLDEATLDRFRIGQVELDYDPGLEAALCPDDELRTRFQTYRNNAAKANLRRVISMRAMRDAYKAKEAGVSDERIDKSLFGGWREDEVQKAKGVF